MQPRSRLHPIASLAPLMLAACAPTPTASSPAGVAQVAPKQSPFAAATLLTAEGAPAGSATIVTDGDGLKLIVAAENLPAGVHGVHVHTMGKCEAPGFATAGGHLNPLGKMHGSDNPMGSHLGDLPNITVRADGTATLSIRLPGDAATLTAALFDADGTAIVIHAAADDYKTDPSGNSGARIACGVLTRI